MMFCCRRNPLAVVQLLETDLLGGYLRTETYLLLGNPNLTSRQEQH